MHAALLRTIFTAKWRMREYSLKLKMGMFRLHIRKNVFTERVGKYWNRLPRAMVESAPLEALRCVDVAPGDIV